jgi:hypothetical protein
MQVLIGWDTKVIAANAFGSSKVSSVCFESCAQLNGFNVPESVEILGDRCFESCSKMETIEFEGSSRLRRIGERAFTGCNLHSVTIPVFGEEIDGAAFVHCPLISIEVDPGSLNFQVEGNLLVRSDGTEILRCFSLDREIVARKNVKVIGKSCFEGCQHLGQMVFEPGSQLERIGGSALRDCLSLMSIEIPQSVRIIEEASFEGCVALESCVMDQDSSLVAIGARVH